MSVRDQERRAREAMRRRSDEVASRIERRMQGAARQANEATLRGAYSEGGRGLEEDRSGRRSAAPST